MSSVKWDYFTYVSDKATTNPPNKMLELFELIETPITKKNLFFGKIIFLVALETKQLMKPEGILSKKIFILIIALTSKVKILL